MQPVGSPLPEIHSSKTDGSQIVKGRTSLSASGPKLRSMLIRFWRCLLYMPRSQEDRNTHGISIQDSPNVTSDLLDSSLAVEIAVIVRQCMTFDERDAVVETAKR